MAKVNEIKQVVCRVLEKHEDARKDDFVLFSRVLDEMGVPSNFDMRTMLMHHTLFGLPSLEGVCRARRRVQAAHPELTDEETVKFRRKEMADYRKLAKEPI